MGQEFVLINLDKWEASSRGGKWLELLWEGNFRLIDLQILVPGVKGSWAGDRIILYGEYSEEFPPGVPPRKFVDPTIDPDTPLECIRTVRKVIWPQEPNNEEHIIAVRNLSYREVHQEDETPVDEHVMKTERKEKAANDWDAPIGHGNAVEVDAVQDMVNSNKATSRQVKPLSAMERTPEEILDVIFAQVDRESLPSCVYLSSRIYSVAIKRLYYRVQLMSDKSTRNFAETVLNRPILKHYVRQLLTVIEPHWESVAVLHNILKQLPYLTLLEIGPSWITYGDLPYWEYPFKLEGLKWGLIKDEASKKFIESQKHLRSEVVYWALPRYFGDNGQSTEHLPDGEEFREAGWNLWKWGAPQYSGKHCSFDRDGGNVSD
ncbi:hypothetical protein CPB86DRAFT_818148 [Serendipita vermifera]|nr:hypothetical protein CPB86DRAFT_818148 [Serendipita vermifera]